MRIKIVIARFLHLRELCIVKEGLLERGWTRYCPL